MKRFLVLLLLLVAPLARADNPGWLIIEEEVAAEIAQSGITIVHFWAPWCPNSAAEHKEQGWSRFIAAQPEVRFIFITIRSSDPGYDYLAVRGVGGQENLRLRHHPNHLRRGEGRITSFMDIPLSWVPSTWIFREGRLCYALNYGEVRFPMLAQLVEDAKNNWEH
jgi:thiol-disulfide isomerase/thioredoxin